MDTANLFVEEATSTRAVRGHWQAWCQLHEARLEDDLCSAPEYLAAELESHGGEIPFRLLFVYREEGDSKELVGCFPLALPRSVTGGPLTAVDWWGSELSTLSHPLLHRDYGADAVGAVLDWLAATGTNLDVLNLPLVNLDSRTWQVWTRCLDARGLEAMPRHESGRPTLRRYDSLDHYLAALSPRRRKNYRRLWRRLNDAGSVDVVVHRGADTSSDLPRQFMQMEAAGWKGRENTALGCSAEGAEFFTDLVYRLQQRDELFCVEVRLDGRPVAMSCSFTVGTTLFGFKVAHDPEFEAFSPGSLVAVQEVNAFLANPDLVRADSGSSESSFIGSYWPQRERVAQVLVPVSARGRFALQGLRAAIWVKQQVPGQAMPGEQSRRAS